ncbi:MAG: Flp family type IVb pilin [Spirochaetia bacterium]|nr:Flp family type IVb pilin [Spirochaetia bacterium]
MKKVLTRKKGQGMTEYILIIALVAILVLGAVKIFGGKVKGGFDKASEKIGDVTDNMGEE